MRLLPAPAPRRASLFFFNEREFVRVVLVVRQAGCSRRAARA